MAIRMKDIALDLGVSVVTVCKALQGHTDIGVKTRERVLERIKELNYRPNATARALVTGRTHLMGLIVPDLVHPFFAQVARGASRILRKEGYSLIISSSEEDPDLEREEIDQMLARRLDVLIVASAQTSCEGFRQIAAQKRPYVLIDRRFAGFEAPFVGIDDVKAGAMATEHLIEQGCRRIAYIGGRYVSTALDRVVGYRKVLKDHGLQLPEQYVVCRARSDDAGDATAYRAMKALLSLDPAPDGVFCGNDQMAMGAMQAILEAGLRIPQDLAIVGCGNVQYAAALRVPLSSVDQDSQLLGERAAKLALGLLGGDPVIPGKPVLIRPKLMVRESSTRLPVS